ERGHRVHIVCHTRTHAERVQMLFEPHGFRALLHQEGEPALAKMLHADFSWLHVWQGALSQSQHLPNLRTVVLNEEDLFGHKKRAAKSVHWKSSKDPNRVLATFRDLKVGDFVVHKDHGIGRYLGLKSMGFLGLDNDYVLLEYKDGDKLYI